MTQDIEDAKAILLDMVFHADRRLALSKASLFTQLKMQKQMMRQSSEVRKAEVKIQDSFTAARESLLYLFNIIRLQQSHVIGWL